MLPKLSGELRVGADPTLRFSKGGMAICSFSAVADKSKKDEATGEWEKEKEIWIRVTTFKDIAEHVAETVKKGDLVFVEGQVSTSDWTTKEGVARTSIEVTADIVGPSLRYATATVLRAQRSGAAPQQQGAPANDPWSTATSTGEVEPPF